jgi:exodeoxyribonuclease-5
LQFRRRRGATPVDVDVVAIDEASMLGADVMRHARSQLANKFVLLIGDQAQLPPVNEEESQAFQIRGRSELTEIMRQAADNPIIKAATIVRHSQGGAVDWTWCRENRSDRAGVFVPEAHRVDAWLKKAFTHPEFEADPDSFRYLAWTNRKVASINAKVRRWRYGMAADEAPFVIGEKALVRAPIIHDDAIVAQTGEEIAVLAIEQANFYHALKDHGPCPSWLAEVPSWLITGKRDNGEIIRIHMIRNRSAYEAARNRILAEAIDDRDRWGERRDFDSALADLQPIYAMTVHASQGSTFGTVFVDVRDIKGRMDDNLLEMQQLLYVALTRPSTGAVLIGAPT